MNNKKNNENNNDNDVQVVIGDSSKLKFSEVGDYMGDLKPRDIKGSKKNIIIPTNKKNPNKKDKKPESSEEN